MADSHFINEEVRTKQGKEKAVSYWVRGLHGVCLVEFADILYIFSADLLHDGTAGHD